MSDYRYVTMVLVTLGTALSLPLKAQQMSPYKSESTLNYVEVFDGNPEGLALLEAEPINETHGIFKLQEVFKQGRYITLICKYSSGVNLNIIIQKKVEQCSYYLDNAGYVKSFTCK